MKAAFNECIIDYSKKHRCLYKKNNQDNIIAVVEGKHNTQDSYRIELLYKSKYDDLLNQLNEAVKNVHESISYSMDNTIAAYNIALLYDSKCVDLLKKLNEVLKNSNESVSDLTVSDLTVSDLVGDTIDDYCRALQQLNEFLKDSNEPSQYLIDETVENISEAENILLPTNQSMQEYSKIMQGYMGNITIMKAFCAYQGLSEHISFNVFIVFIIFIDVLNKMGQNPKPLEIAPPRTPSPSLEGPNNAQHTLPTGLPTPESPNVLSSSVTSLNESPYRESSNTPELFLRTPSPDHP